MSRLSDEYHRLVIAMIQQAGGSIRIPFRTLERLQTGELPVFVAENDDATEERVFRLE